MMETMWIDAHQRPWGITIRYCPSIIGENHFEEEGVWSFAWVGMDMEGLVFDTSGLIRMDVEGREWILMDLDGFKVIWKDSDITGWIWRSLKGC